MDVAEIQRRFSNIRVWTRGKERALHKPLLLLYALGRCAKGDPREIPFREADPELARLLQVFGPIRPSPHTEYPFWRLQNDKIWTLTNPDELKRRASNTDAKCSELLEHDVKGGFLPEIHEELRKRPGLVKRLARELLEENFPSTYHEDLAEAVGLDLWTRGKASTRDPRFRNRILEAYGHKCSVCSFDLKLGYDSVGLEAAHIMWHQAGGPDEETNGLALCALHHKLFDRGAFTLDLTLKIRLSRFLTGNTCHAGTLAFDKRPLQQPVRRQYLPEEKHIRWHHQQVFKGSPRDVE